MESELFGYKRGSFTGAVSDKQGLVQSAEGGTLFLDEVADLPLHMQVKLLRVIQEKTVRPVGEQREQPIDVRVLSATHKNLGALVQAGKFREDLYYRINVIDIHVPPLREHASDIPDLAATLLRRLRRRLGAEAPVLSDEALAALQGYAFPGNVRELENILERALTLCTGDSISVADLQLRAPAAGTPGDGDAASIVKAAVATAGATGSDLGDQLEHIERDAILKALEQTRYNKTAAARLLGITFRALRYKVKKLGIE
jgi:two-component system response regulator PilR (NtrC family)